MNSESFENFFDSFGLFGLAYVSMIYSAFDGNSSDDLRTTVNIIDEKTGEKTDTIVFLDDMEEHTENSDAESEEKMIK